MDIFLTSKSAKAILLRGLRIVSKYHFQRFGFYSRSCRDEDGKIKSGVFVWNNWFKGRTSFVFPGAHLWSHISWLQAWRVKSQGLSEVYQRRSWAETNRWGAYGWGCDVSFRRSWPQISGKPLRAINTGVISRWWPRAPGCQPQEETSETLESGGVRVGALAFPWALLWAPAKQIYSTNIFGSTYSELAIVSEAWVHVREQNSQLLCPHRIYILVETHCQRTGWKQWIKG